MPICAVQSRHFSKFAGDVLPMRSTIGAQHYLEAGGGWVGVHAAADTLQTGLGTVGWWRLFRQPPGLPAGHGKWPTALNLPPAWLPKRWGEDGRVV